jgi:hypothetical protein
MVNEHESPTDNYCQISAEYVSDAAETPRRKPGANADISRSLKSLNTEITSKTPISSILTRP